MLFEAFKIVIKGLTYEQDHPEICFLDRCFSRQVNQFKSVLICPDVRNVLAKQILLGRNGDYVERETLLHHIKRVVVAKFSSDSLPDNPLDNFGILFCSLFYVLIGMYV